MSSRPSTSELGITVMAHSIIISDVIELITLENGEQYELHEYQDVTGLSRQELIDSASSVEEHSFYSEPDYNF